MGNEGITDIEELYDKLNEENEKRNDPVKYVYAPGRNVDIYPVKPSTQNDYNGYFGTKRRHYVFIQENYLNEIYPKRKLERGEWLIIVSTHSKSHTIRQEQIESIENEAGNERHIYVDKYTYSSGPRNSNPYDLYAIKIKEDGKYIDKYLNQFFSEREKDCFDIIKDERQVIFTGAPGTGKTYGVRRKVKELLGKDWEERVHFVQFHSSFDYSDFVEGLRPVQINGENRFVRLDGCFKSFCRKAVEGIMDFLTEKGNILKTKEEKNIEEKVDELYEYICNNDGKRKEIKKGLNNCSQYYFIIDEINRADIGKVFGELMFGLEEDYRGVENRFDTQYSNIPTFHEKDGEFVEYGKGEDCFRKGFFIPENVHIIGTMNDIDRSVETFDFALRRRFKWVKIEALYNNNQPNVRIYYAKALTDMLGEGEIINTLMERIKALNAVICGTGENQGKKLGLSEDFCLGPAYFKTDSINDYPYEEIWNNKIEPILREYVRGRDAQKVEVFIKECSEAWNKGSNPQSCA